MSMWTVFCVLAATDAPVTHVTVFSDRAAVTRTASVKLSGAQRVDLPVLLDTVDPTSIVVEASGAEVRRVDIGPVNEDALVPSEARKLLDEISAVDDELSRRRGELAAMQT